MTLKFQAWGTWWLVGLMKANQIYGEIYLDLNIVSKTKELS